VIYLFLYFAAGLIYAVSVLHTEHCGWEKTKRLQWSDVVTELYRGLFWPLAMIFMPFDLCLKMRENSAKRKG